MDSTLHPAGDAQEPDSERSPKRIRLDGALHVTEDVQEEMVDDDDGWDDIYAASATSREEQPSAVEIAINNPAAPDTPTIHSPSAAARNTTLAHRCAEEPRWELAPENVLVDTAVGDQENGDVGGAGDVPDGIPAESLYGGDELVAEACDGMAVDRPGTIAMEGMSEVNGPESAAGAQVVSPPAETVVQDEQTTQAGVEVRTVQMAQSEVSTVVGHDTTPGASDEHGNTPQETQDAGKLEQTEQDVAMTDEQDDEQEPTAGLLQMLEQDTTKEPAPKATEDLEFMAAAAAQNGSKEAEWQFDSSDAQSSSSDSSDSDSDSESDSSDESDGGYELLDPATAAKILMSGEGEDGEDGSDKKKGGGGEGPRTTNEQKELAIKKPDVQVNADSKITMLGTVEGVVENMLLIKGATPGEYQVLESGSVLCNDKREVFGVVGDTLGRVQEPLYSVMFNNAQEIQEAGLAYGNQVYYVDEHSSYVFTQPLKNMKGTDASNIHDEEVGDDEIEFSDDEAEAEWKRQRKQERAARRGDMRGGDGGGGRGRGRGKFPGGPGRTDNDSFVGNAGNDAPQQTYGGALAYDDGDAEDDFYKPLKRPDNLPEIMAGEAPIPKPQHSTGFDRGRGRGRGRGDFRGRGDRGGGRDRGAHNSPGQAKARGGGKDFRGNAHSFPDRHNKDTQPRRSNGHQARQPQPLPAKPNSPPHPPSSTSHGYPAAPQQQHYAQPQPYAYPQQPHQAQTYQFNGYTYQYGVPAPPPQPQQQPSYNYAAYPPSQTAAQYYPQQQQQQQPPPSYGFQPPQAQGGHGAAWTQHHQQAQQPGQPGQLSPEQQSYLSAYLQTRGAQGQQ